MNKILLVGCGHMGSALLRNWSETTNYKFSIIDPVQYKKIKTKYKNKVETYKNIDQINELNDIDIVIFAIKPQIASEVLKKINNCTFKKNTIFISIVAGKKISFFTKFLSNSVQFVRIMPNLPATIGYGVSCLIKNNRLTKKNKNRIDILFSNVGKTLWLKKEEDIDKVTAISGSGPGYIFLFIDAFEKAANELGLEKNAIKTIIHQTFLGSAKLLLKEKKDASILASNIAVKGGTTEAGLREFKNKKILHKIFKKVVFAAYKRANQLGK